jgi:hypothetical protein
MKPFAVLGIDVDAYRAAQSAAAKLALVRSAYLAKALETHPDKPGGDAVKFREVQSAWETLRKQVHKSSSEEQEDDDEEERGATDGRVPSWEWFKEQPADVFPSVRFERARSGRSACVINSCAFSKTIQKNTLRVGAFNEQLGSFTHWRHLQCWRVPFAVWFLIDDGSSADDVRQVLSSVEDVVVSGFADLDEDCVSAVVAHVMNRSNWAKKVHFAPHRPRADASPKAEASAAPGGGGPSRAVAVASKKGSIFVLPPASVRPGAFEKYKFVLTGVFPEVGGGAGLNLGKTRVKSWIESFGGRVVTSITKNTTHLVVGKHPGRQKVDFARSNGVKMVDMLFLKNYIENAALTLEGPAPGPHIGKFSKGFGQARLTAADDDESSSSSEDDDIEEDDD